jgi:hypothetical protein
MRCSELGTAVVVCAFGIFNVLAAQAVAELGSLGGITHHDENMNQPPKHLFLISLCALLISGCCAPRSSSTARMTWEYQIVDAPLFIDLQNAINKRAADGWELMSVHPPPPNSPLSYAVMRRAKR